MRGPSRLIGGLALGALLLGLSPALGAQVRTQAGPALRAPSSAAVGRTPERGRWSLARVVRYAVRASPKVLEAESEVQRFAARLAEVESVYYPKLQGMAFVAPTHTVRGSALEEDVERDYSAWGPYTHFEATLALPLYTFGRAESGARAAEARRKVAEARVREARHAVALEAVRLYMLHLQLQSLRPSLRSAAKTLEQAEVHAKGEYAEASGKISQADLAKLRVGALEIERTLLLADQGAELSLEALRHVMALPAGASLRLADPRIPAPREQDLPDLPLLLAEAARSRPEWTMLAEGRRAARELELAERRALMPTLFVAGRLRLDWAPTRDDDTNPYHYDPYNQVAGGIAVGLTFDMDPWKASARGDAAEAGQARVRALRLLARSGIPLEVRRARDGVLRHGRLASIARRQERAARRWMVLSAAAFQTGTGQARDVLEGLGAYLKAKRERYQSLAAHQVSLAELSRAVGHLPGVALELREQASGRRLAPSAGSWTAGRAAAPHPQVHRQ